MTGFGVMLEAEQVPQFVSQHREQIYSACRRAAGLEFGIVIRSGIDEPAEAGGVSVDPDDMAFGDEEFDIKLRWSIR